MDREQLLKIIGDDDLNLLALKKVSARPTQDERLVASFKEINEFYRAKGREPGENFTDIKEFQLYSRLKAIREEIDHCAGLQHVDEFKLLPVNPAPEPAEQDGSLFNLRHVPRYVAAPDRVERRRRCREFEKYAPLFKACHAALEARQRKYAAFKSERQIQLGRFFLLHGQICFIVKVEEKERRNQKVNARMHVVFENSTESNMLLRSFATPLSKDPNGYCIVDTKESDSDDKLSADHDLIPSGYIYVLSSRSQDPRIRSTKDLYKIGFSTGPVADRIKNAESEPTYLMAPVNVEAVYRCTNINTHGFEQFLHSFFGEACLDISIADAGGAACRPREWFVVPIDVIDKAIGMLLDGTIVQFRYDIGTKKIVKKNMAA